MVIPVLADASRHPKDPEPVRSTKAVAVLVLGVIAVITAPMLGGLVPAVVALVLAKQARADIVAGEGFLTGGRLLRIGVNLALTAVVVAAFAVVLATAAGLIQVASGGAGQDFHSYTS